MYDIVFFSMQRLVQYSAFPALCNTNYFNSGTSKNKKVHAKHHGKPASPTRPQSSDSQFVLQLRARLPEKPLYPSPSLPLSRSPGFTKIAGVPGEFKRGSIKKPGEFIWTGGRESSGKKELPPRRGRRCRSRRLSAPR